MKTKTIIQELNEEAVQDSYLAELLEKIQLNYGRKLFKQKYERLTEHELLDSLRFSDILCRSEYALNRNIALKIISTLFDEYREDKVYQLFSKNVLIKLGNFPSLDFLERSGNDVSSREIDFDKIAKQIFQKTTVPNQFFTDAQFETFSELTKANHFSFSAGTSFGKSFLFTEYVKWLIHAKNASENIAFLVPTRALISQVVSDLSEAIKDERYKIVSNPDIPFIFRKHRFIFVFTPERLISYFANASNPNISSMIIDEAHNVLNDDERASIFYHAVTLAKQKSINLYFASPNIPNPELFLKLVGNSTEESKAIQDLNVVQNKFFLDFTNNTVDVYFDSIHRNQNYRISYNFSGLESFLKEMTGEGQSLIYCNSVGQTVSEARAMSKALEKVNNEDLINLSTYIHETIHAEYYLADLIQYGIGFHFGALPQELREKLEAQFKKGNIKYLFTTSTLLQGVNLPAKNLFILNEKIGNTTMTALNFKNLAGRAGRLSKELHGNIFIVKKDNSRWQEKSRASILKEETSNVTSTVLKGEKNFYKNLGNIISDKPLTNKSITASGKQQLTNYAVILAYHHKRGVSSQLVDNFAKKNFESKQIFETISQYTVSDDILMESTTIGLKYQQQILEKKESYIFPTSYEYNACLEILQKLSVEYAWEVVEDKRYLGNRNKLKYYAVLMSQWVQSKPLNLIIKNTISHLERTKFELSLNHNPNNREVFSPKNPQHLNQVINDLLKDIETILRFKVKNHVLNYLKLTSQSDGDWESYLEYGTADPVIIELQKIGFERSVSIEISKYKEKMFMFTPNREIQEIDKKTLLSSKLTERARSQIELLL